MWALDSQYTVSHRWSRVLWSHHSISHGHWDIVYQTLKMLWSPFLCFRAQNWGYSILQLCACRRSLDMSFELLTPTIGPRASLLWCLDLPIANALQGWKIESKISSKSHKNCEGISMDIDRPTDRRMQNIIMCPRICYSNETDNKRYKKQNENRIKNDNRIKKELHTRLCASVCKSIFRSKTFETCLGCCILPSIHTHQILHEHSHSWHKSIQKQ